MAIEPHEEPGVGEQFLDALVSDADLRQRYLDTGNDPDQVAQLIADHTGKDVEASNLDGIAQHLRANRADHIQELAANYPAMNMVVDSSST